MFFSHFFVLYFMYNRFSWLYEEWAMDGMGRRMWEGCVCVWVGVCVSLGMCKLHKIRRNHDSFSFFAVHFGLMVLLTLPSLIRRTVICQQHLFLLFSLSDPVKRNNTSWKRSNHHPLPKVTKHSSFYVCRIRVGLSSAFFDCFWLLLFGGRLVGCSLLFMFLLNVVLWYVCLRLMILQLLW